MRGERWKDVVGFEGRYQVSNTGRVKSLPFMQRYLLRNGREAFRKTKEKIRKLKVNNSGYATVTLTLDCVETTFLVHRLVAQAFVGGAGETVNHKDGVKANNRATNLEWSSWSDNHLHAVELGLRLRCRRVIDPNTGISYPSIRQAATTVHKSPKTIRRDWART